jgi:predicted Zn-dependent peptidase
MRTLVLLLGAAATAQTVDRTKPPETPPLRDFRLPTSQDGTLPNGLTVVIVDDQRYPMVELRIGFQAGSQYDPPSLPGLSEAAAALLDEGTTSRDSRKIAEEAAEIGAEITTSSDSDFLTISAYGPTEHIQRLLDLAADIALNANFPESEVRLRKQNRLQELMDQRSQPDVLVEEKLNQIVFSGHPYERSLPTEASINAMTRSDLVKFRDRHLAPNNAVLVLVGPFAQTKPVWQLLQARFGKWTRRDVPEPAKPPRELSAQPITLVDRPGSVQANVMVGRTGVNRAHADYYPLLVADTILGGGTSSRLFNDIREKEGFAYHVASHLVPFRDTGLVQGLMQVRNEVVERAVKALLGHFERMGRERVAADELRDVKNYLSGKFVMGLTKPSGVADQLLRTRLSGLTNQYLETRIDKIRRVEPDQVQAASKKYFDPAKLAVVVVGDAKAIQPALEKVGPVKTVK